MEITRHPRLAVDTQDAKIAQRGGSSFTVSRVLFTTADANPASFPVADTTGEIFQEDRPAYLSRSSRSRVHHQSVSTVKGVAL